jgi:hypothetical protein
MATERAASGWSPKQTAKTEGATAGARPLEAPDDASKRSFAGKG